MHCAEMAQFSEKNKTTDVNMILMICTVVRSSSQQSTALLYFIYTYMKHSHLARIKRSTSVVIERHHSCLIRCNSIHSRDSSSSDKIAT